MKLPAVLVCNVAVVPVVAPTKAAPVVPASTSVHCTLAMLRPLASVLAAALSVTVWPAVGAAGVASMCAVTVLTAATAAAASSMPAPQVVVVQ